MRNSATVLSKFSEQKKIVTNFSKIHRQVVQKLTCDLLAPAALLSTFELEKYIVFASFARVK